MYGSTGLESECCLSRRPRIKSISSRQIVAGLRGAFCFLCGLLTTSCVDEVSVSFLGLRRMAPCPEYRPLTCLLMDATSFPSTFYSASSSNFNFHTLHSKHGRYCQAQSPRRGGGAGQNRDENGWARLPSRGILMCACICVVGCVGTQKNCVRQIVTRWYSCPYDYRIEFSLSPFIVIRSTASASRSPR